MTEMKRSSGEFILNESQAFRVLDLLSFSICLYASHALLGNPFFGALLFIAGFVFENYYRLSAHRKFWHGHRLQLRILLTLTILVLALGIGATLLYDAPVSLARRMVVACAAALLTLRSLFTHEAILRCGGNMRRCRRRAAAIQGATTALLLLLLGGGGGWRLVLQLAPPAMIYPVAVFWWLQRGKENSLSEEAEYGAGEIASYRLYNALLLCSQVALYLSMTAYMGMLRLMPLPGDRFLPAALWLALILTVTVVFGHLLKHGRLKDVEKNSLFLIGGVLWLVARAELTESFVMTHPLLTWAWSLVQAIGLALMTLLATFMQEDMQLVLELREDASKASVRTYRSLVQQAAFIIAGLMISLELFLMNQVLEGRWLASGDPLAMRKRLVGVLNFLPLGFVLLSMFFALLQPLSRDTLRKLRLYREQKRSRTVIPALEARLRRMLVKRYRKRFGVKILALLLKPFFYHRVIGRRRVQLHDGPVIFVANHREIYGPIVTNLYLPFSFRPWIDAHMLERESIIAHMSRNTFARVKPAWLARGFMKLVRPILVWLLNSLEPIPVHRGASRELLRTMSRSVTALLEQDNLLIFPEDPSKSPDGRYAAVGISPFSTGFVHVAKYYFRQSGKAVTFYPVFAHSRKRTITIGNGVAYDPRGKRENQRIGERLMAAMSDMAI